MLDDLFKRTEHLVQQSVECKLKQMLKPFKRAFTDAEESYKYLMIIFFKLLEIFASHSKWTKRTMMKWTFCLLHWSLQGRHFQTGLVIYIMPKWFSCRLSMRKRVYLVFEFANSYVHFTSSYLIPFWRRSLSDNIGSRGFSFVNICKNLAKLPQ